MTCFSVIVSVKNSNVLNCPPHEFNTERRNLMIVWEGPRGGLKVAKTLPFGAPSGPCFDSIAKVLVLVIVKVKVNIE